MNTWPAWCAATSEPVQCSQCPGSSSLVSGWSSHARLSLRSAGEMRWRYEFFFYILDFNFIYVCRRHLSMCVNMVMEQVCHVNSSRARAARPSLRTRIVTTRWPFVKLQRRRSANCSTESWSATQVLEQRHLHDAQCPPVLPTLNVQQIMFAKAATFLLASSPCAPCQAKIRSRRFIRREKLAVKLI